MTDPDLKTLWQSQQSEEPPMSLEEIRSKAGAFQRRVRARNVVEYAAGLVVIPAFALIAWKSDSPLTTLGALAIVAGTLVVFWQMHVRGSARRPPEASAEAVLDFQRAEIARQRDALASVPVWYLGPFVPGMALMMFERWREAVAEGEAIKAAIGTAVVVLTFALIWWLNHHGAKVLQREIDKLDALRGG